VVCDAGGGTVDLISYTVVKLEPILEVKEAAPGTGGLCGSTYLNRRFQEHLEVRLSNQDGWDEEVLKEAMEHFDQMVIMIILTFCWELTQILLGQDSIHIYQ
jgi:hypothetical protein